MACMQYATAPRLQSAEALAMAARAVHATLHDLHALARLLLVNP
jgi:hypothetical protein